MIRGSGRMLLFPLLGTIFGALTGGLLLRWIGFPAFLESKPFFVVLVLLLFGLGVFFLVQAIRHSGGGSR